VSRCLMMKVRIGLMGCGRMAQRFHIKNLLLLKNADLAALCDKDEELAHEMASKYNVKAVYGDSVELLNNEEIDAVVITTPPKSHFGILKYAAQAGKHIFVEKPLADTLEECQRAIEVCHSNRVKLMVGFMRRFDKEIIWSKEKMDSGDLGKTIVINSTLSHVSTYGDYLKKTDADIVGEGQPSPSFREDMHLFLINHLVHHADIMRWVGGPVKRLLATGIFDGNNFSLTVILRFVNKSAGHMQFNRLINTDWQETLVVHGTKGSLYIKMFFPYLDTPTDAVFVSHELGSRISPLAVVNTMYKDELQYFLDCIIKDVKPEPDGYQALEAQKIISAIEESLEREAWIDID